ncbi:alcohol dehydrogenase [Rhodothalassium salexigens]|uniref:zinc-dependent alcohol dehydrogenase family protein n=1 Tax=Rhodothalassium salexigens TaxID=1086 RepID=UPI001913B957|nr:zinc-dependent alcohol dehydrogenase family protein [Rhodothalassium salexigens]MBK5919948.1 alcohol dehydrogenase [Rhodothalassium salexigens]
MKAMTFTHAGAPLALVDRPMPEPGPGQVLLRVRACAVCRTDLHLVDGDLPEPKPGVIPGHEIVATVLEAGAGVSRFRAGDRVGVPWLGWTCGACRFCHRGEENLCAEARFTGYTLDGGFADYTVADARYCFPIPLAYDDRHAAPLLCAGLIGWRTARKAGDDAERIGLYGFGAAAHILAQILVAQGRTVFAFTRPGDTAAQAFARRLGVAWAGGSDAPAPEPLDAALLFAPVGALVPKALRDVRPGGRVVCGGIHMSEIPAFAYADLWQERRLESVANLTRADGDDFFRTIAKWPVTTDVRTYALEDANRALDDLRHGRFTGAAVLTPDAGG